MLYRASIIASLFLLIACANPAGPKLPPPTWEEADQAMLTGDYLKAAQMYERLADNQSRNSKPQNLAVYKACVCRLKLGQATQVLPKLQKLASLGGIDQKLLVQVHDTMSETHRMLGQHSESLRELHAVQEMPRQLVEEVLRYDDFLFRFGCAYLRAGQRDGAAVCFRDMMERFPRSFRAVDAALRLAVRGFAVRVGDTYPASEEKLPPPSAPGYACSFVKVDVKGQAPVLVAVVSGLPTYDEALRVAEKLSREGVRAEPLP
jgi:hypothetical protein